MRNTVLSYLLLPLFAGFSLAVTAAPAPSMEPSQTVVQLATTTVGEQEGRLDLNQADAATLQRELNGIGKAKAEAIVAYRDANGPFTTVDELLEIKGIGNALLERNRDKLMVK